MESLFDLQQEYDDNIYRDAQNRQEDLITTLTPGALLRLGGDNGGLGGSYRPGLRFFRNRSEENYVGHTANLQMWKSPWSALRLSLTDDFLKSREPQDLDPQGIRKTRRDYFRNTFSPSLEYQLGPERTLQLRYSHSLLDNNGGDRRSGSPLPSGSPDSTSHSGREDSQHHTMTAAIDYRLGVLDALSLSYEYSRGLFDEEVGREPKDFVRNMARGQWSHRFTSRTSASLEYTYRFKDYLKNPPCPGGTQAHENGPLCSPSWRERVGVRGYFHVNGKGSQRRDYALHDAALGLEHHFSPTLSGKLRMGRSWQEESGSGGGSPGGGKIDLHLGLAKELRNGNASFEFIRGYEESSGEGEERGLYRYWRVGGNLSYAFDPRWALSLALSLRRNEFSEERQGRKEEQRRATLALSYRLTSWLSWVLHYEHTWQSSTIDLDDYTDNRIFLGLVARYPLSP